MKKFLVLLFIIAAFLTGFLLRGFFPYAIFEEKITPQTDSVPVSKSFHVVKILDGDSIMIDTRENIRYLGIDAPETNQPLGISSAKYNEQLVLDKNINVEFDYETRDQYGRLLAYVWIDDILINEKMIEEGYAKVYSIPKTRKLKYYDRLIKAENFAKDHHNGLWLEDWINN